MSLSFTFLDWSILGSYLIVLTAAAIWSSRSESETTKDYFLGTKAIPIWLVAVSVLSTTQSAATFLGGPDYGFRGDYSYLASFLGALVAAIIVSRLLIQKFYAIEANTVYELLDARFGAIAKQAAGAMYLVGRVFAAGARLYMAALAVSMVVFLDIAPQNVFLSAFVLLALGIAFTFIGGLDSVVWSDVVQVALYVGAAILVLFYVRDLIPVDNATLISALQNVPPDGVDKLRWFDFSTDLSKPFSVLAVFTGVILLYAANFGLDQDTSQRLLACKDAKAGSASLIWSVVIAMPVVWLFITIGQLLHIYYERPEIMGATGQAVKEFNGETVTVFLSFILSQVPPGLRGLCAVGVIAAAAINAGINSMASVIVEDFYRPWKDKKGGATEHHYVTAGRWFMVVCGLALFVMSIVCFYWQRATDMPLLQFALSVMTFAYAGLLGVYITTVFTNLGTTVSVLWALVVGFLSIVALQPYVAGALSLPEALTKLAFPFQLLLGTVISFCICACVKQKAPAK
jgi:solute:Na+ symporter, SSS family